MAGVDTTMATSEAQPDRPSQPLVAPAASEVPAAVDPPTSGAHATNMWPASSLPAVAAPTGVVGPGELAPSQQRFAMHASASARPIAAAPPAAAAAPLPPTQPTPAQEHEWGGHQAHAHTAATPTTHSNTPAAASASTAVAPFAAESHAEEQADAGMDGDEGETSFAASLGDPSFHQSLMDTSAELDPTFSAPTPSAAAAAADSAAARGQSTPAPEGGRRLSSRVDLKKKERAALPMVRFEPLFVPPMLDQIASLMTPQPHAAPPTADVDPANDAMIDVSIAPDVKIESPMGVPFAAGASVPPMEPLADLFPEIALPTSLFIMKARLPKNLRQTLARRRQRRMLVTTGAVQPKPTGGGKKKSATTAGAAFVGAGGVGVGLAPREPSKRKKKEKLRNEWSGSDDDDDQDDLGSTASDRVFEAVYSEGTNYQRRERKKPKTTMVEPASNMMVDRPTAAAPAAPAARPSGNPALSLASFGVDTSDDEEDHNDDDSIESEEQAEEGEATGGDGDAEGAPILDDDDSVPADAKEDERQRLKLHAQMELSERRAFDRLVQMEMNDSYAFCDSNPRTMVLSRDSILIKLDLCDILNSATLDLLSEQQIDAVKKLLPECDRDTRAMCATFQQPIFLQSLYEYQELLMTGSLDPDMREMRNVVHTRRRREAVDTWKGGKFERYWGEAFSQRYSKHSEDRGHKTKGGPANVYWKPPAVKADFRARQTMDALLQRCIAGDIFALRRRKMMLTKEKRWPLPSIETLKAQQKSGITTGASFLPHGGAAAALEQDPRVRREKMRGPWKSRSKKALAEQAAAAATAMADAEAAGKAEMDEEDQEEEEEESDEGDGAAAAASSSSSSILPTEKSLDDVLFASIAAKKKSILTHTAATNNSAIALPSSFNAHTPSIATSAASAAVAAASAAAAASGGPPSAFSDGHIGGPSSGGASKERKRYKPRAPKDATAPTKEKKLKATEKKRKTMTTDGGAGGGASGDTSAMPGSEAKEGEAGAAMPFNDLAHAPYHPMQPQQQQAHLSVPLKQEPQAALPQSSISAAGLSAPPPSSQSFPPHYPQAPMSAHAAPVWQMPQPDPRYYNYLAEQQALQRFYQQYAQPNGMYAQQLQGPSMMSYAVPATHLSASQQYKLQLAASRAMGALQQQAQPVAAIAAQTTYATPIDQQTMQHQMQHPPLQLQQPQQQQPMPPQQMPRSVLDVTAAAAAASATQYCPSH